MIVVATLLCVAIGCSSSGSSKATQSTGTVSKASTSSAAGASVAQGVSLSFSGDLEGTTDTASTRVSRCSTINGQFFFEGTVSLAGTELSVKLDGGSNARIEIGDVAADRTWSAPVSGDPSATITVTPDAATSGSVTAVASSAGMPATHLTVHGTYAC